MDKILKHRRWIPALLFMFMVAAIPVLPASAGLTSSVIDNTSCETELDEGIWSNPDGDVTAKDKIISFPAESTEASRIISRATVEHSEYADILLGANFTLDFSNFPEGKKFVFAIGLQSLESMIGDTENVEITFSNNGGLKSQVITYDENGEAVQMTEVVSCGKVGAKTKVSVELASDQNLKVTVGGKLVCDAKLSTQGEGNVGFLQTGSCEVHISDLTINFYKYDRPQNTNLEEDFEEGIFNANLLYSTMITGSKMQVEEYNGSNVMMFKDAKIGYIGTRHSYSNFELTFDVVYSQNKAEINEDGKTVLPRSFGYGVCFGGDAIEMTSQQYTSAADLIVFSGNAAYSHNTKEKYTGNPTKHLYGDADSVRPYNIRVSVIDRVVTVGVRWLEETEYEDFLTYTLNEMPNGYISIWAPSGSSASFAIDNIKIVNKDKSPNLIDVEFKSAEIRVPDDYEFVSQGLVYNTKDETETESDLWYLPILMVAGSCLVVFGAVAGSIAIKGRKKRRWDE